MIIQAGTVCLFSNGSYSDYNNIALARARTTLKMETLLEDFLNENPARRDEIYTASHYEFFQWLLIREYFEEIDFREIHTGDYGEFIIGEITERDQIMRYVKGEDA